MNQSLIQMLDTILEVLELLMISFLYLVSMEYRLEIQTISYGPYDLSMVYKLQIKKSRSSDQKFIFSLLRILILNSGCIEGARYGIFVLYGNFTSKDAIGNYESSGGKAGEDFVFEGLKEGNWYQRMATLGRKYNSFSTVSIDENIYLYG